MRFSADSQKLASVFPPGFPGQFAETTRRSSALLLGGRFGIFNRDLLTTILVGSNYTVLRCGCQGRSVDMFKSAWHGNCLLKKLCYYSIIYIIYVLTRLVITSKY